MLIEASDSAPDELAADFLRFFQIDDWTVLPMRRAASLCAALVRQPESWTFRKIVPDWQWSLLGNQLAAGIFDAVTFANWQRFKDGSKNHNRPKPYPRPGVQGYRPEGRARKMPDFAMIDRELARPRDSVRAVS